MLGRAPRAGGAGSSELRSRRVTQSARSACKALVAEGPTELWLHGHPDTQCAGLGGEGG